jgi:hypothetical protein
MNEKIAIDPAEQQPPTAESRREAHARREGQPAPASPQDVRSEALFPPERREELKGTWLSIQSAFIDEPQQAVRNADGLVKEILTSVSQKFESARRNLESEWDRGEQASTEALRLALQRYRALFDRLLSI